MATGGKKKGSSNLLKVGTLTLKPDDLDPRGVVVVGDKLVITDRKSYKVHVYRRHDGMLLSSTDELESNPRGLCRVSDTELCVAMYDGIIEIMSVQDSGLISRGKTFDLRPTFDECHGVALWNDNIVVSGRKDSTICWCVVSLQDGRPDKLHKVCQGKKKYISFLTVKQDIVYISCFADDDDRGVYVFYLLNPSQPTYTYKHKELGQPLGITVDGIGHLFVCDWWNSSIHHLTGKCELVTIYKNDLPRFPYTIFWDSGVLNVTSWDSNVITMYKTPQQGPEIPAKAMKKVDREDQKEKRQPVFGIRASEQAKVSQKGKIFRVKQEAKIAPLRPVISVDPVKQLTQTLSEKGTAIPAKAMNKVDREDQKEKKQEAKISRIRPVISVDPVEQLRPTLSETGPAIPAKAMTKLDIEDQKEKRQPVLGARASDQTKVSQKGKIFRVKQEAKISPLRPVISVNPVKQLTQTLSETGIHESIFTQLSKDLISKDWRFFFRALSVPDSEIEQIEIDYNNSGVWEQIYRLLCRSKDKGILNKASIIEALKKIGKLDLVTKYTQETFPDS